jgi:glutathione synthase
MNKKNISIGFIMDPIESIKSYKDTTFAMMLAAQKKHWEIHYIQPDALFIKDNKVFAETHTLQVYDNQTPHFSVQKTEILVLSQLSIILMRKDPPFNMNYIYTTYLLDLVEQQGCLVVNKPQSLRDANEKLFTTQFPQCCPPTLISSQITQIIEFLRQQQDIIVKPLDGMGGASIFRIQQNDPNVNVILETLTKNNSCLIMAQRYIPEIVTGGDKRIILINGDPIDYALARIPAAGETRANLATGGTGKGVPLTERDRWICGQIKSTLIEKQLIFVGIDVIGDYLTEINVTSPTCTRELDTIYNLDISGKLMEELELLLF